MEDAVVLGIFKAAIFLGIGVMIAGMLWFLIRMLWIMFGPGPKEERRYRKPWSVPKWP